MPREPSRKLSGTRGSQAVAGPGSGSGAVRLAAGLLLAPGNQGTLLFLANHDDAQNWALPAPKRRAL